MKRTLCVLLATLVLLTMTWLGGTRTQAREPIGGPDYGKDPPPPPKDPKASVFHDLFA